MKGELEFILEVLEEIEWSVDTGDQTNKDTYDCPACGESYLTGVGGSHDSDCRLNKALIILKRLNRP